MALINCPECGKEVSDKASQCPNCGFGVLAYIEMQEKIALIQKEAEEEAYLFVKKTKQEELSREETKKNNIYANAITLFDSYKSDDVKKAKTLFESIEEWKDSSTYIIKCSEKYLEVKKAEEIKKSQNKKHKKIASIIVVAVAALSLAFYLLYSIVILPKTNYVKAIEAFEEGSYKTAQELLSESYYNEEDLISYAVKSIDQEEVYRAIAIMDFLGEPSQSSPDIQNSLFEKAVEMLNAKRYNDITQYIKYINDSNLINRFHEKATPVVITLIGNEEIDTVITLFAILKDDFYNTYEIQEALFQKAEQLIKSNDLEFLLKYSLKISDKALKDNYYSLCNIYACKNFNEGNFESALKLFMELYGTEYESKDYTQKTQSILLVIKDFEDNLVKLETLKLVDQKNLYSYLPDNYYKVISKMKAFVYSMQGAYNADIRYFYVNGFDVYWGDRSGYLEFTMEYDISNEIWHGELGEDIIEANNSEIKTTLINTLKTYKKISKNDLPYTFSEVISD